MFLCIWYQRVVNNSLQESSLNMTPLPPSYSQHILLADDDEDDCFLFQLALKELPIQFTVTIVHNGEELMQLLGEDDRQLPDVLFLDLNMPRKNGFVCLSEIKNNDKLKQLPVIIFSSSYAPEVVEQLYKNGAQYYIRKPDEVTQYKKVIYQALHLKHKRHNSI